MNDIKKLFEAQFNRTLEYLETDLDTNIINELENSILVKGIELNVSNVNDFKTKSWNHILELGLYRAICYFLTRLIKPNFFIETGVLHGLTSSFILEALAKNERGKLLSIDYPSYFNQVPTNQDGHYDSLPKDKEPGWLIPENLVENWEILLGKSSEILPKVLRKKEKIDIFLHDSEHTYDTMFLEFNLVWPRLRKGGLLIADNIIDNTAFFDFCNKVSTSPLIYSDLYYHIDTSLPLPIRFGIIQKK